MTAQQFKNTILQEAIQGRLVPQDPNDEPASILLKRIRKEKQQLVKEGKLKKKDLEEKPISEDEIPFEIPESWEWVRLFDIYNFIDYRGSTPNKLNCGIPLVTAKNVKRGYNDYTIKDFISKEEFEQRKSRGISKRGDILFTTEAPLGNVSLADLDVFSAGQRLITLQAYSGDDMNNKLMMLFMLSNSFMQSLLEKKTGTTVAGIKASKLKDVLIPLPPLAEQYRIVAKIEELLPKVEEYGKAQEKLNKLNEELPEKLKKSVLQEAIEGRLVPQDPNDEPASVLLQKIREEKKQLVKEGKLKKKDLEEKPISEDEIPFYIPESWEWVRLGDIGLFERGNGIKRDETCESGYPCVRYGEMYTKYKYSPTFEKTVSFTSKSVFEKCRKAHCGDLFMALTGENKQDISLAAQYVGNEEVAVGGDLCHFTILEAYGLYFVYIINSTYFSSKKEILATGDIIVHISTDKLASIPVPLPPLAEQKRIVAKIEQLLGEINKLNA